jgi:hypothetical protein
VEYAPKLIYINGIHNTVTDTNLGLEYNPKVNTTNENTHTMLCASSREMSTKRWKSLLHHWRSYIESNASTQALYVPMNDLFANCSKEDKIYPLTTTVKIADAQRANTTLKHLFKCNPVTNTGLEIKLIENTTCVCKDGWLVISKPLQVCAVKWYYHYLQYPGHTHSKETMSTAMYWKGMHTTILPITRSCKTYQANKRWKLKYRHCVLWQKIICTTAKMHLLPKTIISNPWDCLFDNLIGPYTLEGKDNLQIDFMAITIIGSPFSSFKIVQLPIVT